MLRPVAERLITKAKKGDLHNRRQVLATIRDKGVVHELFEEIAPRFAERPGGYTRITKIGPRKGDNAPMAVIELVTESYTPSAPSGSRSQATSTPATAPAATETEPEAAPGVEDPSEEAAVEDAPAEESAEEAVEESDTAADVATEDAAATEDDTKSE